MDDLIASNNAMRRKVWAGHEIHPSAYSVYEQPSSMGVKHGMIWSHALHTKQTTSNNAIRWTVFAIQMMKNGRETRTDLVTWSTHSTYSTSSFITLAHETLLHGNYERNKFMERKIEIEILLGGDWYERLPKEMRLDISVHEVADTQPASRRVIYSFDVLNTPLLRSRMKTSSPQKCRLGPAPHTQKAQHSRVFFSSSSQY